MIDQLSIGRVALLHPDVRDSAMRILQECDKALTGKWHLRIAQGLRTFKEQSEIYAQGRTKPGPIVTKAGPGYSYHNYGLAFDIVLWDGVKAISYDMKTDFDRDGKADWMEIVKICTKEGWFWGAAFGDYPHFEKTFNYSVRNLLAKYNRKEFITGSDIYLRL